MTVFYTASSLRFRQLFNESYGLLVKITTN